jgi:hypothetical protein
MAVTLRITDDTPISTTGRVIYTFDFFADSAVLPLVNVGVTGFTTDSVLISGGTKGVFTVVNSSQYTLEVFPNIEGNSPILVTVPAAITIRSVINPADVLVSGVTSSQAVNLRSTDVLKVQGDYRIITTQAGSITLDTAAGAGTTVGTVVITGDLIVNGATQFGISPNIVEDTNITDRQITLNFNEPGAGGGVRAGVSGDGYSGIKIARGFGVNRNDNQSAAYIEWNENAIWNGSGVVGQVRGIFEFRVGRNNPSYSAIKVNAIRIDPDSAPTNTAGAGQGPRLNLFGSDNPTAVLSVKGTNGYEGRVVDDDDIPNKRYVDDILLSASDTVENLVVGQSYVKIVDSLTDGFPSQIIGVLNGDPTEVKTSVALTGTVVMRITENIAQFPGIQLVNNEIMPTSVNTNLRLSASGSGQLVVAAPFLFENSIPPSPGLGQTGLYVANVGGGGTGVYFVSSSTLGVVTNDEFVSRKRALIFGLIF